MPLFGPPNVEKMMIKADVAGLIKALEYKDSAIRKSSAEALGELIKAHKIGIADAIAAVGNTGQAGVYALECIAKGGSSHDLGVFEPYAQQIIEILHSIGSQEATRVLLSISTSIFPTYEHRIIFAAAKALVDMDKKAARQALVNIFHQKENFYEDSAAEAIRLLSQFNDTESIGELIIALGDCRKSVSQAAAKALDQIGVAKLLGLKKEIDSILQGNPERAVNLTDRRAIGAMDQVLRTANILSADSRREYGQYCITRAHAAGAALRLMGDKTAVNTYINALKNQDRRVREEAVTLLGYIGDKDATEFLLGFMGEKNRGDEWRWAIDALGQIGDERAIPKLRELSISDPWNYYPGAITALLHMGEAGIVAIKDICHLKSEQSFADLLEKIAGFTQPDSKNYQQFSQILSIKYDEYPSLKNKLHNQAINDEVNGWGSIYQLSLVGDFSLLPSLIARRNELRQGVEQYSDTGHGGTTGWQQYGDFFRAVDFMEKQSQELNG